MFNRTTTKDQLLSTKDFCEKNAIGVLMGGIDFQMPILDG